MRVFVTGATGFVGSHVVERMLDKGHEPICLVRSTSDTRHLEQINARTVVGSLFDIQSVEDILKDVDAVVHVAGGTKVSDLSDYHRINGEASEKLAVSAAKMNPDLKRFIYISSIAAQGPSPSRAPRPMSLNPQPVSEYGRSKLAGEQGVLKVAGSIPITIIRPPAVYGPRDYGMYSAFQMVKYGIGPLYGRQTQAVSLIHVYDLADAITVCLEADSTSGSIYTIDDGLDYSWPELYAHIGRALNKRPFIFSIPPIAFMAAARMSEGYGKLTGNVAFYTRDKLAELSQQYWICGYDALKNDTGWQPSWPLAKGAEQTATWYVERGLL